MKKFWLITGLFIVLCGAAWGVDYRWDGIVLSGNWDDANGWLNLTTNIYNDGVPGAGDNAFITDGTVIVGGETINVASITQSGGIITVAGATLDCTGAITQTGGQITGTTLTAQAGTSITLNGTNAITGFTTGTSTPTGAVSLTNNTAGTLTIAANGVRGNAVTIGSAGDITVTGAVAGTGTVGITATGGNITGAGAISGNIVNLTTVTSGNIDRTGTITSTATVGLTAVGSIANGGVSGTTLTANAGTSITLNGPGNGVTGFTTGTSTPSGAVSLTNNTAGMLTIIATGANGVRGNGVTIGSAGNITVTGAVNGGNGTVSITATGGNITGAGAISGNIVNLTTVTSGDINRTGTITSTTIVGLTAVGSIANGGVSGTTLTAQAGTSITLNGTNAITGFTTGTSTPNGAVSLTNNTAGTLTIGADGVRGNAVTIGSAGNITVTGAVAGNGTVGITATGTGAEISGAGAISGNAVTLTASGGNINRTGTITSNTTVGLTAADISGTGAITATAGVVTLASTNGNININGAISAIRLSATASSGTVTIGGLITVSGDVAEGINAAVYVTARTFAGSSNINLLDGAGAVCVNLDDTTTYVGTVTGNRIHYHTRNNRHIVYRPGTDLGNYSDVAGTSDAITANTYLYIQADLNLGTNISFSTTGTGRVFIIDQNSNANANARTVTFSAGAYIEIRGIYTSTGTLTLNPGGTNPVRLVNSEVNSANPAAITLPSFDLTGRTLNLRGETASIITNNTAGISLGPVTSRNANGTNHLTLNSGYNPITVGTMGTNGNNYLGNIQVTNTPTATFTGAIYANSYTQSAGSAEFRGAQNYYGVNGAYAFNFSGTTLTLAALTTAAASTGSVSINSSGNFIQNANISSGGTFSKSGVGNSLLAANIATTNATPTNATITFVNNVELTGNVQMSAPATGGDISLSTVTSTDGRNLILNAGAGNVTVSGAMGITGTRLGNITITGATINLNTIFSAGTTTINNSGLFTANAAIISESGFNQNTTTGTSLLKANISTINNNIRFANEITLNPTTPPIRLDTDTEGGTISLTSVKGFAGGENFTLAAGTGNITVTGAMGEDPLATPPGNRLGTITVFSVATAAFSGQIWANNFVQYAGTVSTTFNANAVQNYSAGFTFTGVALTVNANLNTVGAISITNSGNFTVGASGSILPTGALGTITVSGNTVNNGTIRAANTTATNTIQFNGNYSGGSGFLYGSPDTTRRSIEFGGNALLGRFAHNGDAIVFVGAAGITHNLSQASLGTGDFAAQNTLGRVEIRPGNTVTLTSHIYQDSNTSDRILRLDGAGSVLNTGPVPPNTTAYRWLMGTESAPSATPGIPAFSNGFYGYYGDLEINDGARLITRDFYTVRNTGSLSPAVPPYHRVNIPTGNAMATIEATGNVFIQEDFSGGPLTNSTLEMTGTGYLAVRNDAGVPVVNIGHFIANGDTTLSTNIYFRGNVTIENGGILNGSSHSIFVFPLTNTTPGNIWWQKGNGRFNHGNSIMEFGSNSYSNHSYIIRGDTTWWDLVCREDGASLLFSNYSSGAAGHRVNGTLKLEASNPVPNDPTLITLTVENEISMPPYPNPGDLWTPPDYVSEYFWYFILDPSAKLDLNGVKIYWSFSRYKIPVPKDDSPSGGKYISAWPYVEVNNDFSPYLVLNNFYAHPESGHNRWNVNWFVFNNFFYGFTEDSDHNGRIDRIRLQSAFNLNGNFTGFEVNVRNADTGEIYEIDTSKGDVIDGKRYGYGVVQSGGNLTEAFDLDSIYVYLIEKPYADTGATLYWEIARNSSLKDYPTENTIIGNPPPRFAEDQAQDKGRTASTAPPRITYALALPEWNEIFVQFSAQVVVDPGLPGDVVTLNSTNYTVKEIIPLSGGRELLIRLEEDIALADLVDGLLNFEITGFRDYAIPVENWRDPKYGGEYYFMYPMPKYPQNYNYDDSTRGTATFTFQPYVPVNGVGTDDSPYTLALPLSPPSYWGSRPYPSLPQDSDTGFTIGFPEYSKGEYGNRSYNFNTGVIAPAVHRVSDMLISVPPAANRMNQYFIWPVWARYKEPANPLAPVFTTGSFFQQDPSDSGIIWEFNGKKYLEERDTIMQVNLQPSLRGGLSDYTPTLFFSSNVASLFRGTQALHGNDSLWLPGDWNLPPGDTSQNGANPDFTNITPYFFTNYNPLTSSNNSGNLFLYEFKARVNGYTSGSVLDFFFHLEDSPNDLFVGRLDILPSETNLSGWYYKVRPFSFDVHDVTLQRSGVTILNNVINPDNGERTYVDYRLARGGQVTIQVFTLDGTMVDILYRGYREAGEYRAAWAGTNRAGRAVARGMYYIRVVGPDMDELRKVMVVR